MLLLHKKLLPSYSRVKGQKNGRGVEAAALLRQKILGPCSGSEGGDEGM